MAAKPHTVPRGLGTGGQSGTLDLDWGLKSRPTGRDWPGLGTGVPGRSLGLGLKSRLVDQDWSGLGTEIQCQTIKIEVKI